VGDLAERAREALETVVDPEAGLNIVDLGLIYDIAEGGDGLRVTMTMTMEGCPAADILVDEVARALERLSGAGRVAIVVTYEPPWTPERISARGRAILAGEGC